MRSHVGQLAGVVKSQSDTLHCRGGGGAILILKHCLIQLYKENIDNVDILCKEFNVSKHFLIIKNVLESG